MYAMDLPDMTHLELQASSHMHTVNRVQHLGIWSCTAISFCTVRPGCTQAVVSDGHMHAGEALQSITAAWKA